MVTVSLLLLLAFFIWLAIFANRRIQAYKDAQTTSTEQKLQIFRTWAATTFADTPVLQQWLAQLSDEAVEALMAKLSEFCIDLGFQLDWLLEGKTAQDATIAPRLQTIATQYIHSCYEAYLTQDDIRVFEVWLEYNEQPFGKKQQDLAERTLTRLIDVGVSPQAARSLLTMPNKERDVYIHHAVQEAAEKHPHAFRSVLKSVITAPVNGTSATNGNGKAH
jgi:hypothetical protein